MSSLALLGVPSFLQARTGAPANEPALEETDCQTSRRRVAYEDRVSLTFNDLTGRLAQADMKREY